MTVILKKNIDIKENILRHKGKLLDILLKDQTTKKNIIWATNSYKKNGEKFSPTKHITPFTVTGKYGLLIQPRASKSLEEQQRRTKEKAEVFTPLDIVDKMNSVTDTKRITKKKLERICWFIKTRNNLWGSSFCG